MHAHHLTVDDDIMLAVQERARREKRTAGPVLSDLAREALTGEHRRAAPRAPLDLTASIRCRTAAP